MMKIHLILVFLFLGACTHTPDAGPERPFSTKVGPRNPNHFSLGNGSQQPTPFDLVRDLAVTTGAPAMKDYSFQDWMRPSGSAKISESNDGRTEFDLTIKGLVPNGFYTAWLVRLGGSGRGPKRDLALGIPYEGGPAFVEGTNALFVDKKGEVKHHVSLGADSRDPLGTVYGGIDFWDEIHIAFHADNRSYGAVPGPNHWTQAVIPLRSGDTLDIVLNSVDAFDASKIQADYDKADWDSAQARLLSNVALKGARKDVNFVVSVDGLVPDGYYAAWLVKGSKTCPLGGLAGPGFESLSQRPFVDRDGRGVVETLLTQESKCVKGTFGDLEDWESIELRYYPTSMADGESITHLRAKL